LQPACRAKTPPSKHRAGAIKLIIPNINDTNLKRFLKEFPQATNN